MRPAPPCTPWPREILTFNLDGHEVHLKGGDEPPTAPGLRGRLESVLRGVGADQVHLGKATIASPATSGNFRLVCAAAKDLFSEQKQLFGGEARSKERGVALLAAEALEAAPPSDQEARRVGSSILLHVGGLEKKEKELKAASRRASSRSEKKGETDAVVTLALEELVALTELWGGVYLGFNPPPRSGGKRARSVLDLLDGDSEAERPRTRQLVERGEAEPPSPIKPFHIHCDVQFKASLGPRSFSPPLAPAHMSGASCGAADEPPDEPEKTESRAAQWDRVYEEGRASGLDQGRSESQRECEHARAVVRNQPSFAERDAWRRENADLRDVIVLLQEELSHAHRAWEDGHRARTEHRWDGVGTWEDADNIIYPWHPQDLAEETIAQLIHRKEGEEINMCANQDRMYIAERAEILEPLRHTFEPLIESHRSLLREFNYGRVDP